MTDTIGRTFPFYCAVDIVGDRKVMTISSSVIFINRTALPLECEIMDLEKILHSLSLVQNQSVPIPLFL